MKDFSHVRECMGRRVKLMDGNENKRVHVGTWGGNKAARKAKLIHNQIGAVW